MNQKLRAALGYDIPDDTKLLQSRPAGRIKLARRFNGGKVEATDRVPVKGTTELALAARILMGLEFALGDPRL